MCQREVVSCVLDLENIVTRSHRVCEGVFFFAFLTSAFDLFQMLGCSTANVALRKKEQEDAQL